MNTFQLQNEAPSWLKEGSISDRMDAREMLSKGEHPLALVLQKANSMPSGSILELITPFLPKPLIEKIKALGHEFFSNEVSANEIHSYFYKH